MSWFEPEPAAVTYPRRSWCRWTHTTSTIFTPSQPEFFFLRASSSYFKLSLKLKVEYSTCERLATLGKLGWLSSMYHLQSLGSRSACRPLQDATCGCRNLSGPGLKLMLIVIGVVAYQAPSMLALASLREISSLNAGWGCHVYAQPTTECAKVWAAAQSDICCTSVSTKETVHHLYL